MDAITDAQVGRLLSVLTERLRADEKSAEAFRSPRAGILEQASSGWNHIIVGRRGTGKSMLLLNVVAQARRDGRPVAYIDLETLRNNPYPDVLIRLLIELISVLRKELRNRGVIKTSVVRRELKRQRSRLALLLREPQETLRSVSQRSSRGRSRRLRFWASASRGQAGVGGGGGEASFASTRDSSSEDQRRSEYTLTKMQGLESESIEFRQSLSKAVSNLGGQQALIVLDDFYFIERDHQADVLSYLHQVTKGLGIWLKIGAVRHRLREYVEGDPPKGIQVNHDAAVIEMDTTLADFAHTESFLEDILQGICAKAGADMDALVTDTGRTRLVLASGGAPRDYINLVIKALIQSQNRTGNSQRPQNRINAEDVNDVAPSFFDQREEEMKRDADAADVDRLRARFNDVLNFCIQGRRVNVFLVEARYLREEEWGRDVASLADLRFIHRVGNVTVKSSRPEFTGHRYIVFALDLSSYAGSRITSIAQIDFWTPEGKQRARAARCVYTPAGAYAIANTATANPGVIDPTALPSGEDIQLSFDDVVEDQ